MNLASRLLLTSLSLCLISRAVAANEIESPRLEQLKTLRCRYGPGAVGFWKDDGTVTTKSEFGDPFVVHFDAINLKDGTARVIGKNGSSDVTVLSDRTSMTFVERGRSGVISFTTVFALRRDKQGHFAAVTSQHADLILGEVLAMQDLGTCEPLNSLN